MNNAGAQEIAKPDTAPSEQRPDLEITSVETKITERTNYWWRVSWKVEVINSGREDKLVNLNVRFIDVDGYLLTEDFAIQQLARSGHRDMFIGDRLIEPNQAGPKD